MENKNKEKLNHNFSCILIAILNWEGGGFKQEIIDFKGIFSEKMKII